MPDIMNYISFFVGIAGFIFTLLTFNNTRRFKRLQIDIAERNDFRDSSDDFISQIEGAIASIQDDKLRSDTFTLFYKKNHQKAEKESKRFRCLQQDLV